MHIHRLAGVVGAATLIAATLSSGSATAHDRDRNPIRKIDHIVVIYQENHSFDNLYGRWEHVNGLRNADAAHTVQVNAAGVPLTCLPQNDVNLTSPTPLPTTCTDTTTATVFNSAFTNRPFDIDGFITPTD